MTSLESILEFIEKSKNVTVNYQEKGYKVSCHLCENEKWNTPHITIRIIDCYLPEREHEVTVEYRKGEIFQSLDEEVMVKIRHAVEEKVKKLKTDRETKLHDEFSKQLISKK